MLSLIKPIDLTYLIQSSSSCKIILINIFHMCFTAGVPFLITAELFKQSHRPSAYTVAGCLNWLSNFTIGFVFPFLEVRENSWPTYISKYTELNPDHE